LSRIALLLANALYEAVPFPIYSVEFCKFGVTTGTIACTNVSTKLKNRTIGQYRLHKKFIADIESLEAYISREELALDALVVDTSLLFYFY